MKSVRREWIQMTRTSDIKFHSNIHDGTNASTHKKMWRIQAKKRSLGLNVYGKKGKAHEK